MDTSMFERIASSITVKWICDPLGPDVPATTAIDDLEEYLDPSSDPALDPWNNPSRVIDSNAHMVGILWFENWACFDKAELVEVGDIVSQVMQSIEPNEYVSSGTTILDAVGLFGAPQNTHFYVLDINNVIGNSSIHKPLQTARPARVSCACSGN